MLLVAAVGCSRPAPLDLVPLVATAGAGALVEAGPAVVPPTPAPAPAGKCKNCNGTGVVGDGRVSSPCPVCRPNGGAPSRHTSH